mgnify:FL=1|tara:strand:+ start:8715 stop:9701 length:987 start_codon:yes stop_codon:yes gene_type:complete
MATLYDKDIDTKFFGGGKNWLGIVLPFDSQEQQFKGQGGFGYRRRVAIMGHHPSSQEIKDSNIVFALVMLGVTDGTGAANRDRKIKIAQGDVVVGIFLDDAKQEPMITGVLGRTKGIKYGKGRFDIKSGYSGGSDKKLPLTATDESTGDNPSCFPLAINATSKQDRVDATGQTEKSGVSTEPEKDTLKEPPIDEEAQKRIDEKVKEKVEEGLDGDEAKSEAITEVDEELREEANGLPASTTNLTLAELRARTAAREAAGPQVGDKVDISDDIVRSGERKPITEANNTEIVKQFPSSKPSPTEDLTSDAAWEDAMNASREEIMDSFELQ